MNQTVRTLSIAVATIVAVTQTPSSRAVRDRVRACQTHQRGDHVDDDRRERQGGRASQINADGTHKVTKIISSTNPGDNAAATEIANSSTYRPAHRGTTPIAAFYDFTLRFNGRTVVRSSDESSGVSLAGASLSPAASQVAALIRAGQYAQAKSKAQMALLSSPGDDSLREMLGVASYDSGDFTAAAAAFDKVPAIGSQFHSAAAQSFRCRCG